ncbi:dUTPase [Weissella diestrammenae]|uniref:dUTPase n=1 Tax=Weissella diestrammenae TaxID=1162633 RepID=A0A7G9T3U9_9LACO|nr:dUTPase [Weissella diestrammenae]MCM0582762.1 dUTPase [Weissella diestrammenae]QNN74774.1 dUTPase [Weissella diestrammenae]
MQIDIAKYLRNVRPMFRTVADDWERPIKRDDYLLNDYLNLLGTLGQLQTLTQAVNPNVPVTLRLDDAGVDTLYATGLVQFLLISLKQQWIHLMVLEPQDLQQFAKFPQRHLNHQFIGIDTMLLNSYHQRRQSDFAHAWRSYLKLGLNELHLDQATIDSAVTQLINQTN